VWLYGGERPDDDNAMKAAGLELQGLGLIATSQMTQLHVPLMALVHLPPLNASYTVVLLTTVFLC